VTSRVWKQLGTAVGGRYDIRYRLDGIPLCVDCEYEIAEHIQEFMMQSLSEADMLGEYETTREYEGRVVTFQIVKAGYFLMEDTVAFSATLHGGLQVSLRHH
jgi:hypothetical protein